MLVLEGWKLKKEEQAQSTQLPKIAIFRKLICTYLLGVSHDAKTLVKSK